MESGLYFTGNRKMKSPLNSRLNVKHHKKISAFTLVELLVVISIIALLLSILMPSLRKAREAAKVVVCKSNIHQISLGMLMYVEDNNLKLPPYCNGFERDNPITQVQIDGVRYNSFRTYALMREWAMSGSAPSALRDGKGFFAVYMASDKGARSYSFETVLGCPSLPAAGKPRSVELKWAGAPTAMIAKRHRGFGINYEQVTSGVSDNYGEIPFNSFRRPSELVYISETSGVVPYVSSWCLEDNGNGKSVPHKDMQYNVSAPGNRHSGRFNALFLDGHVVTDDFEDLFVNKNFIKQN
jgi:prepilin-type processing-associated H-X9-DG protein/prepilin-type N-terminal cleavage/methylation domain-containing protein